MYIGIYPDEYNASPELLPWAEPAMSIAGGAWTNRSGLNTETGWTSVPHDGQGIADQGAQVFVFFEAGDVNKPIYFAAAQSGPGWLSEHQNQHVFRSDNVTVRIDENPDDERSTCQYLAYNENNSALAKDACKRNKEGKLKTRIDIDVLAKDINAVNLNIIGDVNMHIDGDWYVEHNGKKFETHTGDTYIKEIR